MPRTTVVAAALWLLACGGTAAGALCNDNAGCAAGLVCTRTDQIGRQVCMRPCDPEGGIPPRLCSDGAACLTVEGALVCYLGGHRAYGHACSSDEQCEPGTVCSSDRLVCEQACTVGDDRPCRAGQTCVAPGLCRCTASALDGGACPDGG